MYRFRHLNNGLVSRGWYCDEVIVRLVWLCYNSRLAMWKTLYMMKEKVFVEAASINISYNHIEISHENEQYKKTSQMAKKWMQLKIFQLMHQIYNVDQLQLVDHMLIVWAWLLVNELHIKKNRNEFIPMIWVSFVSFRWNNE